MVSYVVDVDGKRTHIMIPIDEWENMGIDIFNKPLLFSDSHISVVTSFIKENHHLNVIEWKKAYSDFYQYYKQLNIQDILALYLFRSLVISQAYVENNNVVYKSLFTVFPIKNLLEKDGSYIKEKSLKVLQKAMRQNSEIYFIQVFKKTVDFNPEFLHKYKTENQRLRRDAERDRLFIYDLEVGYAISMYNQDIEFQNIFTNDKNITPGNLSGLIRQYIAERLYNGNKSQVSRACIEGEERLKKMYPMI